MNTCHPAKRSSELAKPLRLGSTRNAESEWLGFATKELLWWALVTFAMLDAFFLPLTLRGQWWCAFFVLWIVPWRRADDTDSPWVRNASWLSALFLFAWLIYRTQTAICQAVLNWHVFWSMGWWRMLSFLMQSTLGALVTAALVVVPLRRLVGDRATTFVILASLPYALMTWVPIRLSYPPVWTAQPWAGPHDLLNGALSVLIVAEVSSLLTRFPFNADRIPGYRSLRSFVLGLLNGKLNALAAFVLYSGVLVGAYLLERAWADLDFTTPVTLAIYSLLVPVSLFIVPLSAVAAWRSLRRMPGRHAILNDLATLGRVCVGFSATALVLAEFFLVLPRTGNSLSDGLQLSGDPLWSISPTKTPGGLRLSGELNYGVSTALDKALRRDASITRLELDSPGGDVNQGLALADLVEKYSLSTFVPRRCSSACTFVFVAGQERTLARGAKLGFHRARALIWDDILYHEGRDNDEYMKRLVSEGIDKSFALKAFSVPSSDIWYPSVDELLAAGVISAKP